MTELDTGNQASMANLDVREPFLGIDTAEAVGAPGAPTPPMPVPPTPAPIPAPVPEPGSPTPPMPVPDRIMSLPR